MEKIDLTFDPEVFPQIALRYSPERLRDTLLEMCKKGNLPVTADSLYSQAAILESDLQNMFPTA